MKAPISALVLVLTALSLPAMADDIPVSGNLSQARETWQQLSPEQKQAIKAQAKENGMAKKDAWEQLGPEEKEAYKSQAKDTMQAKKTAWDQMSAEDKAARRGAMQETMRSRMQGRESGRPFGRR